MSLGFLSFRRAGVVAFALAAFGCGADELRRGGEGDSCTRTDDCAAPLSCRSGVCAPKGTPIQPGAGGATPGHGGGGGSDVSSSGGAGGEGGAPSTTSSSSSSAASSSSSSASSSSSSSASSSTSSSSSGTVELDPVACNSCLQTTCEAQRTACDAGCLAIEACIETECSSTSLADESTCFVHCQQQNPGSKQKHLDVVYCAQSAFDTCAPCSSYPFDFLACTGGALEAGCGAKLQACNESNDCKTYRDCTSTCSTAAACFACDDTPAGAAGAALLLDYNQCIAEACILQSWLK